MRMNGNTSSTLAECDGVPNDEAESGSRLYEGLVPQRGNDTDSSRTQSASFSASSWPAPIQLLTLTPRSFTASTTATAILATLCIASRETSSHAANSTSQEELGSRELQIPEPNGNPKVNIRDNLTSLEGSARISRSLFSRTYSSYANWAVD